MPGGSGDAVEIVTGVLIASAKFFSSITAFDVTRTLKLELPAADGVPLMTPAVERDKPPGREPLTSVQLRTPVVPPVASSA